MAILVAGMHRSGTSALTKTLNILGCDLPKTLLKSNFANQKGFWESSKIIALNDEILRSANSAWYDCRLFDAGWYASSAAAGFRKRAWDILGSEFDRSSLFVVKDPRICRLLKFWTQVTEEFGATPRIVMPVRHPAEVSASLHARDEIPLPIGHILWLCNLLNSEIDSRQYKRVYVRYDDLLDDWSGVVASLSEAVGMTYPKRPSSVAAEIQKYLSPRARHHVEKDSEQGIPSSPGFSPWLKSCVEIFFRWTHGEVHQTDAENLDRIRAAFDEATKCFAHSVTADWEADKTQVNRLNALRVKVGLNPVSLYCPQNALHAQEREIRLQQAIIETQEDEIGLLNQKLTDMENSDSWRATALLRTISSLLTGLLRRR